MTRSLTKELFTPFKNSEPEFCSSRNLFKTTSLDESSSPEFDLFSNLEEHYEEEVAGTMAKTMEEYMCKTQELHDNTFSGSDHEDANEHIEKVLEIVDLFHIPNITQDQIMIRAFPMSLTGAVSRWLRNKPSGSITTWEDLKTKFLNKYCPLAQTTKKMEEINNFQQEPDETLYQACERFIELLMKYPQHYLTDMQEVILFYNGLEVLTRQILDSKGDIPTKTVADETTAIQEMAKYSQKWHNETFRTRSIETSNGLAATKAQLNNLGREIKKVNEKVYAAQVGCELYAAIRNQGASIKALEIQIGQMSKVLQDRGSRSLPSSTETNRRYHVNSISMTVETDTTPIRRIGSTRYTVSAQQNRLGELAHTKLTVELADRTVKHPKGITENILVGIDDYPSNCDFDRRIHIDCAYNLKFSCVMGFDYRSMDPYLDEGIGDVTVGEPFCKASFVEAIRFNGIITICDGDDSVTYQMEWSNPRFKHLTNEKCNKIPPLMKVSEQDKMNGISHPYQKLKGFYKGVLNLGPEFIRGAKVEEWLTRKHISVHEME
ncbi:hypothetical protein Tco_1523658 [Tanacetum coccineum]